MLLKIWLVVFFLSRVGLSFADEVCRPVYNWPKAVGNLSSQSWQIRYQLVKQEMEKFSKQVGHCYNRKPKGKAERVWMDTVSVERIIKVGSATNVKKYCENVHKYLIDEKLPNPFYDKSPFSQYANCEEGKAIGACLAYSFGFKPQDILLCDSLHDHAWALVREARDPGSYCLLDRWNTVRCGVKLNGVVEEGIWRGDVIVKGSVSFKFNDSVCNTLENQFKN